MKSGDELRKRRFSKHVKELELRFVTDGKKCTDEGYALDEIATALIRIALHVAWEYSERDSDRYDLFRKAVNLEMDEREKSIA